MIEKLKALDLAMMKLINRNWSNEFLDAVVPWLRYQQVWYPFYVAIIAFAFINFGRKAWWWIAAFIGSVASSDLISSRLIKNTVLRLRPCADPDVFPFIELRVPNCSGGYSFTSSHAANHFSMAMFMFVTLYPLFGKKMYLVLFWAASIAYAQVYVGVHYPLDVLFGSLVGILVGWLFGQLANKKIPLATL